MAKETYDFENLEIHRPNDELMNTVLNLPPEWETEPEAPEPFDFGKWLEAFKGSKKFSNGGKIGYYMGQSDMPLILRLMPPGNYMHITHAKAGTNHFVGSSPATQEEAEILFRLLGIEKEESNEI